MDAEIPVNLACLVSQITSSSKSTLVFGVFSQSKMPMVFPSVAMVKQPKRVHLSRRCQ